MNLNDKESESQSCAAQWQFVSSMAVCKVVYVYRCSFRRNGTLGLVQAVAPVLDFTHLCLLKDRDLIQLCSETR